MALPVYWHPWVSSSASPSTPSPTTRCLNTTTRWTVGVKNRHTDRFEMLNVPRSFTDCAGCCQPSAQCDKELWIMWPRHRLAAPYNGCREDQPHLFLHPRKLLYLPLVCHNHLSSCFYVHLVLPETATRGQQELEVNLLYCSVTDLWRTCFFPLQNTTSNKYHLSEVSLSAAWPDMKGESLHLPVFMLSTIYQINKRVSNWSCDPHQSL